VRRAEIVFGASRGLGARRVAPVPARLVALGKGWIDPRAADAEEFGEFGLGVVRRIVKLSLGGWITTPPIPSDGTCSTRSGWLRSARPI
jgi:hypothetical protein